MTLDGGRLTADLSTGPAGLLVPLAGGALLAWLGTRQPRVVTTLLAVLLGGSLVQSVGAAASAWRAQPARARDAVVSVLEWSRNGNVLVLVLDSLQSDVFEDVLEAEPRLRDELDGFRYYRLASSNGPTTYLSLPTIHGGRSYDPGQSWPEFYREAVYEGSVLNRLAEAGYRTSYAVGIGSCPKAVASCVGTLELARSRVEVPSRTPRGCSTSGSTASCPTGCASRSCGAAGARWPAMSGGPARGAGAVAEAAALDAARLGLDRDRLSSHRQDDPLDGHPSPGGAAGRTAPPASERFDREAARLQAQCAFRRVVALLERLRALGVYDVSSIVIARRPRLRVREPIRRGEPGPEVPEDGGGLQPARARQARRGARPADDVGRPDRAGRPRRALCGEAGCSPADGLRGSTRSMPGARARPSGTSGTTATGTCRRSRA